MFRCLFVVQLMVIFQTRTVTKTAPKQVIWLKCLLFQFSERKKKKNFRILPKDLKKWVIISFWSNRIQRPLSFRRTIFFFVSICLTFFNTSTKDHSSSSSSGHPSCLSLTPNPKLRFLSFSLCDLCSHLYLIFIFLFFVCLVSRKFLYFLCFLLLTNHIQLKKLEKNDWESK